MSVTTTVVLGAEHDRRTIDAAQWALKEIGAKRQSKSWGVGGSQEISREEWKAAEGVLVIESETYLGLSVSGPEDLVAQIAQLIRLRLA